MEVTLWREEMPDQDRIYDRSLFAFFENIEITVSNIQCMNESLRNSYKLTT